MIWIPRELSFSTGYVVKPPSKRILVFFFGLLGWCLADDKSIPQLKSRWLQLQATKAGISSTFFMKILWRKSGTSVDNFICNYETQICLMVFAHSHHRNSSSLWFQALKKASKKPCVAVSSTFKKKPPSSTQEIRIFGRPKPPHKTHTGHSSKDAWDPRQHCLKMLKIGRIWR